MHSPFVLCPLGEGIPDPISKIDHEYYGHFDTMSGGQENSVDSRLPGLGNSPSFRTVSDG
eukprot:8596091-Alexandrium_andersonii.AAC.1